MICLKQFRRISFPIGDGEEKVAKVGEIVYSLSAKGKERDDSSDIELESQELCKIINVIDNSFYSVKDNLDKS